MSNEDLQKSYRLIIPIWAGYFILGSLVFLIFAFLMKIQVIERLNENIDSFEKITLPIILLLFSLYGFYLYISPFYSKLTITDKGFIYQTITITLSAEWAECELINHFPIIFGRFGLIYPFSKTTTLSKVSKFMGTVNTSGGVPMNFYGRFTSKKLKQDIRFNAPYLFGVLYTDQDFTKTLTALDFLANRYLHNQLSLDIFCNLYGKHYSRYILNGGKYVVDYFTLASRYIARLSIHAAIWSEIIQKYYESSNNVVNKDNAYYKSKLEEIKERYTKGFLPYA